jgi:hypothetical protein
MEGTRLPHVASTEQNYVTACAKVEWQIYGF